MSPLRRAGVLGLLLLALAGGCAAPLPEPAPEPEPAEAPPATTTEQTARILAAVGETLQVADAELNAAAAAARLTGPALAIRTAEYVRASATAGAREPTVLPTQAEVTVVATTRSWPRSLLVVTEQPEDLQAQRVLLLTQAAPREQYMLWGWARLGPSVVMPSTVQPEFGSEPVAPDAEGFLVPPGEVPARFADLLANGDASPFAADFAPDFLRTSLGQALAGYRASVEAVGSVTETYAPADTVVSFATADGGVIVVGHLVTTTAVDVTVAGASLTIADPFEAALLGASSVADQLARTWTDVVVWYVPPAGSQQQVQVLAAEHALTAVTGS